MFVENVLVRSQDNQKISISWTSETDDAKSFIFINGKLVVGSYMAETKKRSIVLPVPTDKTFKIEVHDFTDNEVIPNSIEEPPLVKPQISWNGVEEAVAYKIYQQRAVASQSAPDDAVAGENGSITSLLTKIPARSTGRIEIDCPTKLEGKGGRWHSFRVESVDQFGNESINEVVPYFAADLPPPPELVISRDTKTGLLSFRIICSE